MKLVDMTGPSLRDPSQTVNRKVPAADVQAYRAAGYVEGTTEGAVAPEDVKAVEPETEPKAKKGKK